MSMQELQVALDSLRLQEAANRELLREIADLKLKHDYQVRRADISEKHIKELKAQLDTKNEELQIASKSLSEAEYQSKFLEQHINTVNHILTEVAAGRFQRRPLLTEEQITARLKEEKEITLREQAEQGQGQCLIGPKDDDKDDDYPF